MPCLRLRDAEKLMAETHSCPSERRWRNTSCMAVGCRGLHCSDEFRLHNFADFKINDLWRSHEKPPRSARCSWRHGAPFDNGDDAGPLHTLIDLPWLRLLLRRLSGRTIRAPPQRHRSAKPRTKDEAAPTP